MARAGLDDRFDGDGLDLDVWLPHYLPHWSSRADSAAAYSVSDGALEIRIPRDHPIWCPETHEPPIRVSCLQTGTRSGPVGSTDGPQPIADHVTVASREPTWWGCTPRFGRVEIAMRGDVTPRSMFAFWLSGIEDVPEHSAEICVAEVFGRDVHAGHTEVGMGVHAFRNPAVSEDWETVEVALDVTDEHVYACDWDRDGITFLVDGEPTAHTDQSPDHLVQLMVGVFDFPSWDPTGRWDEHVPTMTVSRVTWTPRPGP